MERVSIAKFKNAFDIWFATMRTDDAKPFTDIITNGHADSFSLLAEAAKFPLGLSSHTLASLISAGLERLQGADSRVPYFQKLGAELKDEIHTLLGDNGVFLYPTSPQPAVKHNETILKAFNVAYTAVWNCLFVAVTQVPLGLTDQGLPIGMQVIAGPYNDHLTIGVAEELEKKFGGWVPPSGVVN